jgi:tetratricopeptide (TPR) repeat protein
MYLARIVACILFVTTGLPAIAGNGLAAFEAADYDTAIPLLQSAVALTPKDTVLQAALLSALVYKGRIEEASDAADSDAINFPGSPEVIAARGDYEFYMGNMPEAEKLYKTAAKLNGQMARAYYGLYRLYCALSFYRMGRLFCLKAHELDPEDALITQAWLRYVPAEKRNELLSPFAAAHPWLYKHYEEELETSKELSAELNKRKPFEVEGGPQETTLHLMLMMNDAQHARGVGLEFRIGNGHPLRLLLDTGASGIVLRQTAVDKAELNHLGSGEAWGVGDKGKRKIFAAVADTCTIASIKFKTCIIRATEGKARIAGDEDGLIGADIFADYLITIDFQKHLLHLKPLPPRPPNPQGYDREVSPEEANFTPVFRFGHHLLVTTTVNRKSTGLFLIDTGAGISNVDSTFARLSTKIRGNDYLHVRGVSGEVKNVFEADKAELRFSHFEQKNLGLTAFNLNNQAEHQEVRLAGVLGMPVLAMFRLTIDYRNGLVNFDYVLK